MVHRRTHPDEVVVRGEEETAVGFIQLLGDAAAGSCRRLPHREGRGFRLDPFQT